MRASNARLPIARQMFVGLFYGTHTLCICVSAEILCVLHNTRPLCITMTHTHTSSIQRKCAQTSKKKTACIRKNWSKQQHNYTFNHPFEVWGRNRDDSREFTDAQYTSCTDSATIDHRSATNLHISMLGVCVCVCALSSGRV